ncbi:hypothetical protein [Microbacterium sp. NPDC076911]|uniref:hypothetical protein n=1 Tax=Microbacterium sp. NPDC076911 TaxID=3154958 RepID=UPI00342563D0
MTRTTRSTVRTAAVLAALTLGLTGCSSFTPPWSESTATPTPTPTATAEQPVPNDISSGSTAREMVAGPLDVSIDYWSTLSMDQWTAGVLKPVSVSLTTEITPDDGQSVYLQRATMIATPASATETFDPLSAQVDSATTTPGYLVIDPYSYTQTFMVAAVPEGATYVTLQFTYEFLVQSTPTSSDYAKQTASETLTVAIAP